MNIMFFVSFAVYAKQTETVHRNVKRPVKKTIVLFIFFCFFVIEYIRLYERLGKMFQ
jgi:hypothetical protein